MAVKTILTDCRVEIAGTSLGNAITSAEIQGEAETKETTGFSDTNRTYAVGFKNWTVTLNFHHDYTDDDLNELLFGWWGTSQAVKIRKSSSAISTTNPEFQGSAIFTSVPVFNASVGEVSGGSITLQGTGTLTRATT